ncbi:acyclic terpene utilization AtuA family protein [Novipirellula caenicola]|uniref:DUF1446 domain-containing protein n=1 Tax=Novipirellula caenicola TaxID=1536901 RepID=A0ABP9VWX2_9BACT
MVRSVRIGNAQAFWGDRSTAASEMLALEPELGFLTLDYLAEVSMSILASQRQRDPQSGYAADFVDVIRSLVPYWAAGGTCRVIANAGGLNPMACAHACRDVIESTGCPALRIGVVTGDDVLIPLRSATESQVNKPFANLDTGVAIDSIRDRLVTANAYLGAAPIAEALDTQANIVITGRVADPSMVVAACMHHFEWTDNDLDRLAGATVAGHLIECGTQVTGGICTDWLEVPNPSRLGFPIVEVADDGTCIVTKPTDTGGHVTVHTVKEQLVYEIGDPDHYLSPDVTVSFTELQVDEASTDRVRVWGAIGRPRPAQYKVSATYRDGFRSAGMLTIVGRNAKQKAMRAGEMVLDRLRESGVDVRNHLIECLGSGACATGFNTANFVSTAKTFDEVVLRIAVEVDEQQDAQRFTREVMPLITAGPQGTTGYAEGRPRVHPVIRYWPCLIPRDEVQASVEIIETEAARKLTNAIWPRPTAYPSSSDPSIQNHLHDSEPTCLYDIAMARSGDKGTGANIGVIARKPSAWEFLRPWLTAERVAHYFSIQDVESVDRFELPKLQALNFVIRGILQQTLRTDAQGKTLGQILLEMPLPKSSPDTKNFTPRK